MTPGLHNMLELARIAGWDWGPAGAYNPIQEARFILLHVADSRMYRVPDSPAGLFKLMQLVQENVA